MFVKFPMLIALMIITLNVLALPSVASADSPDEHNPLPPPPGGSYSGIQKEGPDPRDINEAQQSENSFKKRNEDMDKRFGDADIPPSSGMKFEDSAPGKFFDASKKKMKKKAKVIKEIIDRTPSGPFISRAPSYPPDSRNRNKSPVSSYPRWLR
jgi:hypothetical protein